MDLKSALLLVLKGAAMGAANVIPGVSGGTVAFITGIYERLINALKSIDLTAIRLLARFQFREFAKHIDLAFLACLGVGLVLSIFTFAKVLKWAFEHHDTLVWAFFFGLILTSIPPVAKMVKHWTLTSWIALFVGGGIAVWMAFSGRAEESRNFVYLMICGVVAICAMILPGISGSFVLLIMGNYELVMLDSVNYLRTDIGQAIPILIPVGLGAVLGLVLFSRFLSWLFKNYHDVAVSLITGFLAGSLAIIWPWKDAVIETLTADGKTKEKIVGYEHWRLPFQEVSPGQGLVWDFADRTTWLALGFLVMGALLVWIMERSSPKKEEAAASAQSQPSEA